MMIMMMIINIIIVIVPFLSYLSKDKNFVSKQPYLSLFIYSFIFFYPPFSVQGHGGLLEPITWQNRCFCPMWKTRGKRNLKNQESNHQVFKIDVYVCADDIQALQAQATSWTIDETMWVFRKKTYALKTQAFSSTKIVSSVN